MMIIKMFEILSELIFWYFVGNLSYLLVTKLYTKLYLKQHKKARLESKRLIKERNNFCTALEKEMDLKFPTIKKTW